MQADLSEGRPTQINTTTVDDFFSSFKYINDMTAAGMARKASITRKTSASYIRGTSAPRLNLFVRIMDRLGYEVWVKPKS